MTDIRQNGGQSDLQPPNSSVKKLVVWLARKLRDHLVSLVIAGVIGYGVGIIFGKEQSQYLVQNSFGPHCARDIFNSAKKDGLVLNFERPAIEHIAICGPGKYRGDSAEDILKSYINTYQPKCLSLQKSQDGYVVGTANSDEVIEHHGVGGTAFYTCRCKQDQAEVMFKYLPQLCGADTPRSS